MDLIEPDTAFTRLLMSIRETTHIVLGSRSHYERIYGISVDHETSMNLAVDYLAKLGHRDIGFFYTGTQYYGTKEKMERFHQEMALSGLPVQEAGIIQVQGYDCGSGREGIEQARFPSSLLPCWASTIWLRQACCRDCWRTDCVYRRITPC